MYISLCVDGRYKQKCFIYDGSLATGTISEFVIDTGAPFTTCIYHSINPNLREADLRGRTQEMSVHGYISEDSIAGAKHYLYETDAFYVGSIPLGRQKVWVTFDERVNANLLGLDLLRNLLYMHMDHTDEFVIFNDRNEFFDSIGGLN